MWDCLEGTACRDKTAAQSRLAALERRAELVKGNVLTAAEDETARQQTVPLDLDQAKAG